MNLSLKNSGIGLFVLRVGVSLMMLTHGYPKLIQLFGGGIIQFADPIGIGTTATLAIAVFSEFLCSIFLIIGLKTRLVAIAPAITMLIAALVVHGPDPFRKKELALFYFLAYLVLIISGGGKPGLDSKSS